MLEVKKNKNIWLGFQKKTREEKISVLFENKIISKEYKDNLDNNVTLPLNIAEQMAENTIGTFSLPFSIVPSIIVDNTNYTVPMVTEEPSVIAACSYASKLIGRSGGFYTKVHNRKMIGEVALFDIPDVEAAISKIEKNKKLLLEIANNSHPSIVTRGGGAVDIKIKVFDNINDKNNENNKSTTNISKNINNNSLLVVYLIADVKEAMGANIINNMLEGIKPVLVDLSQGEALMAILSNYATESLVTSFCEIDIKYLSNDLTQASNIAKKIELASKFSKLDIYRATTHNKGIFNGIDAVVIATGNDWRAIEAGGHAYATKNGNYEGLTTWTFDEEKLKLIGELTLPMPIATVGGSIGLNPTVKTAFNILNNYNIEINNSTFTNNNEITYKSSDTKSPIDAKKLAGIIVSIGLAQNFAAIKALVSTGIQKGHMKLQAKSLALFAGATSEQVDLVVEKLLNEKYINLETAKKIIEDMK